MSYRLVKYEPKYRRGIAELQRHLWTSDIELNAEYFAWQYEQNPYLDDVLIYLALQGDQVVGMRGLLGARWCFGDADRSFSAPCVGDTVVAPDHRRKGVMREILQFVSADNELARFPYVLSFSANAIVYRSLINQGWHTVGQYREAQRSHRLLAQPMLRRRQALARRVFSKRFRALLLRTAGRVMDRDGGHHPDRVSRGNSPRPSDMARLVRETDRQGQLRHLRDEIYYAWRFRSPLSSYRFYYWQDTSLRGFLITQQTRRRDLATFNIVDWQSSNDAVLRDLLLAVIRDVGVGRLAIWTATLPAVFFDALQEHSFETVEDQASNGAFERTLLVSRLNESLVESDLIPDFRTFGNIDNWALRMIYSNFY